jgi:hypothetical protein
VVAFDGSAQDAQYVQAVLDLVLQCRIRKGLRKESVVIDIYFPPEIGNGLRITYAYGGTAQIGHIGRMADVGIPTGQNRRIESP